MFPFSKIYSMGVSLGANNLLFWLGTLGEEATKYVDAAVAVCCPMDLMESRPIGSILVLKIRLQKMYIIVMIFQ